MFALYNEALFELIHGIEKHSCCVCLHFKRLPQNCQGAEGGGGGNNMARGGKCPTHPPCPPLDETLVK